MSYAPPTPKKPFKETSKYKHFQKIVVFAPKLREPRIRRTRSLRSLAIEPFNGLFKNIFEWRGQMPVKGLKRCQVFALGAILLYQIVLLYQHQRQQPVGVGIKALLRAA